MPVVHNCGGGCSCSNCGGCIRSGTTCHIFSTAVAERVEPGARLKMDDTVTISVSELSLAEVGAFVGSVVSEPLAIPADARALAPTTLRLADVTLSTVIEQLGLVRLGG